MLAGEYNIQTVRRPTRRSNFRRVVEKENYDRILLSTIVSLGIAVLLWYYNRQTSFHIDTASLHEKPIDFAVFVSRLIPSQTEKDPCQ